MDDALKIADQIIADLNKQGLDYSSGRDEIARVINDDIWNGNWDSSTDFGTDLRDLRIIEENEYDQSMDEDEKPDWDSMLTDSSAGYVFYA